MIPNWCLPVTAQKITPPLCSAMLRSIGSARSWEVDQPTRRSTRGSVSGAFSICISVCGFVLFAAPISTEIRLCDACSCQALRVESAPAGPHAPHLPSTPAPWYAAHPIGLLQAPRSTWSKSYNYSAKSHHPLVAGQPILDEDDAAGIDDEYARRMRSLLSVDDFVLGLYELLERAGEWDQTFVVFTSDHVCFESSSLVLDARVTDRAGGGLTD